MSSSTNPFAAALQSEPVQQERRELDAAHVSAGAAVHHPNNPFAASHTPYHEQSAQLNPSTSPSTTHTNPFQKPATTSTGMGLANFADDGGNPFRPVASDTQSHAIPHQTEPNVTSASDITASLSGLDFSPTKADNELPRGLATTAARSAERSDDPFSPPTPVQGGQQNEGPPPRTLPTVYAPPPGPPPGHSNDFTHQDVNDTSAVDQVRQMESDEAYARRIWEHDAARHRRRDERALQGRSGSGDPDRQRQKRRQRSGDPSQAGFAGEQQSAAVVPTSTNGRPAQPASTEEKQWNTKEIYWRGRSQRVVVQNENGPCSLIALCNVLLMRGNVAITPEDRPAVSYEYLSSMLGEHLIDVISTNASGAMDLEAALSILPQTQHGLDVNVQFSSIDGFALDSDSVKATGDLLGLSSEPEGSSAAAAAASSSSAAAAAHQAPTSSAALGGKTDKATAQRGELALFKLCNVPLVHGWLADRADEETWAAVVERAGDYDTALDRVVAGDELTRGFVVGGDPSDSEAAAAAAMSSLMGTDRQTVNDALLIRRFLEATATQLTYPGLYALSTSLERGALYALFRNSHLSVLYRPTEDELMRAVEGQPDVLDQPQLYQLVTDATLESEDAIVWESVEDVDGSASRFYDGKFRPARVQEDFVGRRTGAAGGEMNGVDEDADFAYAQHLQQEERMRAQRHRQAYQSRRQRTSAQQTQRRSDGESGGGSGLIARMLAKRKASKTAPSSSVLEQNVHSTMGGSRADRTQAQRTDSSDAFAGDAQSPSAAAGASSFGQEVEQKQKWWKKVF